MKWVNKLAKNFFDEIFYLNSFIDLLCKSMDWFLYDNGPHHERVKNVAELFCRLGLEFHACSKNVYFDTSLYLLIAYFQGSFVPYTSVT